MPDWVSPFFCAVLRGAERLPGRMGGDDLGGRGGCAFVFFRGGRGRRGMAVGNGWVGLGVGGILDWGVELVMIGGRW